MLIIHNSLSFAIQDHVMFWAASTLAYFRFLRSAEFTVPSLSAFNPDIHLTVDDIGVDSHTSQLTIKVSKTDPFSKGLLPLHWPRSSSALCLICYHELPTTAWPVPWSLVFGFQWSATFSYSVDSLAYFC